MAAFQALTTSIRRLVSGEAMRLRVMEELESMSARELCSLGITRTDFRRLAAEAAAEARAKVAHEAEVAAGQAEGTGAAVASA